MRKTISMLGPGGYFLGPVEADACQVVPGDWLIPAGAIDVPPPAIPDGQRARHDGDGWVFEEMPNPIEAEPAQPTPPDPVARRRAAYRAESDPLFFRVQRGEATHAEWLAAVAAIQERYPLPA